MRLLLDENLGIRRWVELLTRAGHDVERVVDVGLQGAGDAAVVVYACEHDRALVSRDTGREGPDDLRSVWLARPAPRPLLLLIYPGDRVTPGDVVRAVGNLEEQGITSDQICAINAWRF